MTHTLSLLPQPSLRGAELRARVYLHAGYMGGQPGWEALKIRV